MTTYSYTTLSDPSTASGGYTIPVSINDGGQVTGSYFNGNAQVGFLYSNGTWTTLSDPLAGANGFTNPTSINDKGQVTGTYNNGTTTEGFLYNGGTWTTLRDPSAAAINGFTLPTFINDKGQVIGYYNNGTTNVGFLYSNGTWTNLSDPLAAPNEGGTFPSSINDSGQVTGYYFNGTADVGFLYGNGTWTTLSDPSAGTNGATAPTSINDRGQVTGYYGTTEVGFLYSNGTWTTLSDPSAAAGANGLTVPHSINDSGQITGYYKNNNFTNVGFLYSNGTWTTLSDPSARANPSAGTNGFTVPYSINDKGQITGVYFNGTTQVGFIATPTDVDNSRETPKLTITDHSLTVAASGSVLLPISVKANDADDTVSVKFSGLPSYDTITAGDGHAVAKSGDSYTFALADVQSGLTLHSSFEPKYHPDRDRREHDRDEGEHSEHRLAAEQSKLTVTAFNRTHGEYAATTPQTITVTTTPPMDRLAGLFNQFVAAGFHDDLDGAGQMTSSPDKQGHQENLALLTGGPHHHG